MRQSKTIRILSKARVRKLRGRMNNHRTNKVWSSRIARDCLTEVGLASQNTGEMPPIKGPRQLIWSSRKPDDWEILVYNTGETWEACFFRWPIHHEHVNGPSFTYVRQRAEQRIYVLEAAGLKTAEWRQTIGCVATPGSGSRQS
jgi:hypothetical protein